MRVIWEYPPDIMAKMQKPLTAERRDQSRLELATRHAETLGRIDTRIASEVALRAEKNTALQWCRANGNPHLMVQP